MLWLRCTHQSLRVLSLSPQQTYTYVYSNTFYRVQTYRIVTRINHSSDLSLIGADDKQCKSAQTSPKCQIDRIQQATSELDSESVHSVVSEVHTVVLPSGSTGFFFFAAGLTLKHSLMYENDIEIISKFAGNQFSLHSVTVCIKREKNVSIW